MKGYLVSFRENAKMLWVVRLVYSAMKLDDTMLMYGIYNMEMLEKLINTIHEIHNVTSSHEKLFAGEHNPTPF